MQGRSEGAICPGPRLKGAPKMKIRGIQSEKFKSPRYKYEDITKSCSQKACGGGGGMTTEAP